MNNDLSQQETGFAWVYTLVFVFVLVILHFILFPAINSKLVPVLIENSGGDISEVSDKISNIVTYWRIATYGFLLSAILYSVFSVLRRERQDYNI